MITRRSVHPLLLVALVALLLLSARMLAAQGTPAAPSKRIAVATHALPRGTWLAADDVDLRDTTARAMVGEMPDTTPVMAGWVTRRAINAGELLRTPAVEAPAVVNANSPVQLEFADKNVTLTMRGTATQRGAVGERVQVRTEMGKRLEGTVVAAGRVRID